jgi:hypothetical protein
MAEQIRPGRQRRRAVARLGVPGLIVAMLTLVALWRIGPPASDEPGAVGTKGGDGGVLEPLTRLADVLTANALGRRASLENVPVRQLTSESTFWAGELDGDPVFVVLDKATSPAARAFQPGTRVTLVGTVEPVPDPEEAARAWGVDQATVKAVRDIGVYLRATQVTPTGRT